MYYTHYRLYAVQISCVMGMVIITAVVISLAEISPMQHREEIYSC